MRASEDEMAGWHHQCSDMNLGKLGDGKGGLACCMGSQRVRYD